MIQLNGSGMPKYLVGPALFFIVSGKNTFLRSLSHLLLPLVVASRIPQIFKNRQTKCEGLSLALFVFSVAGNLTYCASILIKSTQKEYVIENMSWLVGSLGTVFLDFIVLAQFVHYRDERDREERLQREQA